MHCNKDTAESQCLQYQEKKHYSVRVWCKCRQKNIAEAKGISKLTDLQPKNGLHWLANLL